MASLSERFQQIFQAVLIAYIAWSYYKKSLKGATCDPDDVECKDHCFSATYEEARSKFLDMSAQLSNIANTYNIAIDKDAGLFTDVTIVNEDSSSNRLLIHLSGVHGVEGYTGSGIQYDLLDQINRKSITFDDVEEDGPPIIMFVHAVNPYGFARSRRVNENNVDLNRNFKTQAEWDRLLQQGPNSFHYDDLDGLYNPRLYLNEFSSFISAYTPAAIHDYLTNAYIKWAYVSVMARSAYYAAKLGSVQKLKASAIVGQMHKQTGYQYVGSGELEKSYSELRKFLSERFNEHGWSTQISHVTLIDVHSGDDTYGVDKLLTSSMDDAGQLKRLLLDYDDKDLIQCLSCDVENEPKFIAGAYEHANGYSFGLLDYVRSLTGNTDIDTLGFAEEFGTNHRLETVGFTQIVENAWFQEYSQYNGDQALDVKQNEIMEQVVSKSSGWLKDVFYVQEPEWKKKVVKRARRVFGVCLTR